MTSTRLAIRPLTPTRWADLERLFGPRGACAGCWCMHPRLPRAAYEARKGEENRRALRQLVALGAVPGVLAYEGTEPVGWCAIEPRAAFPRLERSRLFRPINDRPAWVMWILPEDMRGRAFAVLRTIMQAGAPLGGLAAGWLLPRADVRVAMLFSAALAGLPGLLGARVGALRTAGTPGEMPAGPRHVARADRPGERVPSEEAE